MKKIYYIVLFVLSCNLLTAQYRYKVEYDFEYYVRWGGSRLNVNLSLVVPPNTTGQSLVSYVVNTGPIETAGRSGDRVIETTTEYTHINRRINSGNRRFDLGCWDGTEANDILPGLADPGGRFIVYRIRTFAEENNYDASNNTLLECESTSLQVTANVNCTSQRIRYGVQYQVGSSTTWTNLYDYRLRSKTFNISMSDFPGLTTNQSLRLRLQYSNTPGPNQFSDIITYTYTQCSPGVNGPVVTTPTSCSYTDDGRFTINFDRPLNGGETLLMTVYNESGQFEDQLTSVNYTGTSYTWPNDLADNRYYVEYQSNPTGNQIVTEVFEILQSPPVSFSASWTDVDCFGENTGSIQINASGGVGNYQYQLDSGSWINFSGTNSHIITNLTAGNYQIRVRDGNQCTEQL